jgi:hypothetical protein
MARFRDFKKSTVRDTPQFLAAELRGNQLENEAIASQNAQRSEDIGQAIKLYDVGTDEAGVTPIKDGFNRMFGSDGTPLSFEGVNAPADMNAPDALLSDMDAGIGTDVGATPFAPPSDGLNLDLGVEDDSIRGLLNKGFDTVDPALGMTDAAAIPADLAADTTGALDTASKLGESAEALETASTLGAGVDGLAAAAGNIPVLGGISTLASAESPEQAAAELALMSNPYTGLLLSAYKMFS